MDLDKLEKYNPDLLMHYIRTGKTNSLPEELVKYMDLLELVRGMYDKYHSRQDIMKVLQSPTYGLTRYISEKIFFDSLNFFYADNNVKQSVWANICAKRAEDLYFLAVAADDKETARRCNADFAKYKRVGMEEPDVLPKEMFTRPIVIYTMDAEEAGIPKINRTELAQIADSINEITEAERRKVKRDGGILKRSLIEDLESSDYEEVKG